MKNFIVSARKFRPATFDTVIGQSSTTRTLKNAINSHHLAQAYLFCGPRGVGKTTIARIFAKTINCENLNDNLEPCDDCESCKAFNSHRSTNIHELDAASNNTVDNIRSLIEQVRIPPQVGKYSIYIIDEVHMLSSSAFNAFLKTLEEPPSHAIFILATTEKHKIIPTILSRCQIFDFNRIKVDDIVAYLEKISNEEGVNYEKDALTIIAQKADGAMRDALSIYDQVVSFSENEITYQKVIENLNVLDYDYYFRLTDAFINGDHSEALLVFNEILDKGFDAHQFINALSKHFRNLLVCKDTQTLELLEVGAGIKEKYKIQGGKIGIDFLIKALNITNQYDVTYKSSMNQRLHIELALIDLCNIEENVKKKPDGEGEGLTEEQQKKTKKTTSVDKEAVNKENEVKESAPKNLSSNKLENAPDTFSINNALNGKKKNKSKQETVKEEKEVEKEEPEKELGEHNFSQEELESAWKNFAETVKDRPRLYNIFISRQPKVEDNYKVILNLENPLQKEILENIFNKLLFSLQRELNNKKINIEMIVSKEEGDDQNNKIYTVEDKFNHLAGKNQSLKKLKRDFDLDFDY
jgi:DNA polymerase-3 subunit gamma/tau